MKFTLIGAAAVAAAAFVTPALAKADGVSYHDGQYSDAVMSHHAAESEAYRYHGGPKSND
jgi:hypothetical protein